MANARMTELLEQAQWVIRGTVQKEGSTTTPEVPASRNTLVVRVDEILRGPSEFSDHLGREITLYSEDPDGLSAGSRAVFFTRSWIYGRSLAVFEVGRLPRGDDPKMDDPKMEDAAAKDIADSVQAIADRRLAGRIAKAELVVAGEVVETRPGPPLRRPIETEHAPLWWEALLKVGEVLKGQPSDGVIAVAYPSSLDEMWIESPKLERGITGILVLQRDQDEKGWPVLRVPGLTALDPLDHQPIDAIERVRRLVGTGGPK